MLKMFLLNIEIDTERTVLSISATLLLELVRSLLYAISVEMALLNNPTWISTNVVILLGASHALFATRFSGRQMIA